MNGNILLDTNIVIYLSQKSLNPKKIFVAGGTYHISVISKIELLGYPFKNEQEERYIQNILNSFHITPLTDEIVSYTIDIIKKHRIKIPDAIIYATAKFLHGKLITNNTADFQNIIGKVEIFNPMV
jgi:predicted nucleic acid-binding protein